MKAVVLAGGEGIRLRPLTSDLPKPMVPLLNRPLLEHVLTRLKGQGIQEAALALSYLPHVAREYFADGTRLGMRLTYPVEERPLGTAGAVKNCAQGLADTFVVLNGDIFTDLDLRPVLGFHRQKGAVATIVLTPVEDPTQYGVVEQDASGRVKRFLEKPPRDQATSPWINAGTYVLEPQVLEHIPPGQHYMFERGLFPSLLEMGLPVYAYPSRAYWKDLGTPAHYLQLHRDILQGRTALAPEGEAIQEQVWVGPGCRIAPSAELRPPLVLGAGCTLEAEARVLGPAVVGPGCTVGAGAVVDGALLWSGVRIGAGSTVTQCILANDVTVGEGASIGRECVLGSGAVVDAGSTLGAGLVVWPSKQAEEGASSRS